MTISGALAMTGGILFVLSGILAAIADDAPRRTHDRWVRSATAALALAVVLGIAAAWVEALS